MYCTNGILGTNKPSTPVVPMPSPVDIWSWGPEDPILERVSFDFVRLYYVSLRFRLSRASYRHGLGGKFFYLIASLEIIA